MAIEEPSTQKEKVQISIPRLSKTKLITGSIGAVLLLTAAFFFIQWQEAKRQLADAVAGQRTVPVSEAEAIVKEVSRIILLPTDETPTITTITDKEKLQENREFFANAENGDKVLIYSQAKMVYLYRPSTKKLINLAPININGAAQENATQLNALNSSGDSAQQDGSASVVLRNGTSVAGLTRIFEDELLDDFDQLTVSTRENASRTDYKNSQIIIVNESKRPVAQALAEAFSLEVTELPSGETKPAADLLIIVGADQAPPSSPSPAATPTSTPPSTTTN